MSVISDIEDKHIQGFELEDKIHDGEKVVGCFYKNSGTINLININKQYNNYKGKEIEIKDFGTWYIHDIVPKQEKISSQLKLYDLSYRFDENYDSSIVEFPCTNGEWAAAICLAVGLELGNSNFPNSEFELSEQPYLPDGATFRDAIKMIAESAGCFVQIGIDNKVYIRWFDDTTIEIEDWFSLSQDSETNPINIIILGRGDVEDNIQYPSETPENPIELRIDDNQILYFNREETIIPIYNQVNGFKFFPFKMQTVGRPSLKAGMKIQYTDIDGMQIETAVMYHKIEYKGGLDDNACYRSTIESYELKETSTNYQYSGTIEKRLSRAERITDMNNNQIIDIIEEQTIMEEKVGNILDTEGEAKGKNIHIEDSAEEPFVDISLHGESIQEGTPTPDTPISIGNIKGNIEFKSTGKNFCNLYHLYEAGYSVTINGITYTVNDDGSITANGTATANSSFYVYNNANPLHLLSDTYRLSGENSSYSSIAIRGFYYTSDGTQKYVQSTTAFKITEEVDLRIYIVILSGQTVSNLKFYPMLEAGEKATEYEEHKEQTATFPLGEEKLYEGSYLADDGIHHTRGQTIYDGSDDEAWVMIGTRFYIANSEIVIESSNAEVTVMCDKLKGVSYGYLYTNNGTDFLISNCGTSGGSNRIFISTNIEETGIETVEDLKIWLASNPITVEYDLAEEEIVAYTEDQQEAWNAIREMTTYNNITNITSTAYAKIVYVRNNGLSDMYETKQNAEKNYIKTNEKLAEQKITTDSINNTVSETVTKLNNDYLTAEQINAELDSTKDDIEVLQQKQAQTQLTSEAFKVQIDSIINDGVSKVKTSMGYTFGDDGLIINKEDAETGTIIDEASVRVIDKTGSEEQDLLYAGYVKEDNEDYPNYVGQTIVASTNMIVKNYLVVPNSRFEAYENPVLGGSGTGAFEV